MVDAATIASLATAAGTLVLAVATFSSVRSANRAARVAEQSLLVGTQPVLIPSRESNPDKGPMFGDGHKVRLGGYSGGLEFADGVVYLAIALRNEGAGLAVLHGWRAEPHAPGSTHERPELSGFRVQQIDIYIPAHTGRFWLAAVRDPADELYAPLREAAETGGRIMVDLLYGDHQGGQRTILRLGLTSLDDGGVPRNAGAVRYWNVDGADPRPHDDSGHI
jgi:hypothetical protein